MIAICAVGLLVTNAQAKGGKKGGAAPSTTPSEVYAKYDANSNSVLDDAEKETIRKVFALLKQYDTNNDAKLSDDEIAAIPATKTVDAPAKKKGKRNK